MRHLDVTKTLQTVQSRHWKGRMASWMAVMVQGVMQSTNATKQPKTEDLKYSPSRMVDGVHQAKQLKIHSTNMENQGIVKMMVKEDHGLIRSITLKVMASE